MIRYFHHGDTFPCKINTLFLYQCTKCNNFKVKEIIGDWSIDHNDDDDDNGPPKPILCPDDFYDSLKN